MLNTFSYESNLSQLPKRDNLHIKDKRPAPNLSVIRKFYCINADSVCCIKIKVSLAHVVYLYILAIVQPCRLQRCCGMDYFTATLDYAVVDLRALFW